MQNLTCLSSVIVNHIIQYWYYIIPLYYIASNGTCYIVFTSKRVFYCMLLISYIYQIIIIDEPLLFLSKFWKSMSPNTESTKCELCLEHCKMERQIEILEFSSSFFIRQKIFPPAQIYNPKLFQANWYFQIMGFRWIRY